MRLELLAKDSGSGDFGCPSIYLADDGVSAVVHGDIVDPVHLRNVLPGEAGVRIRLAVLVEAVRRYEAR